MSKCEYCEKPCPQGELARNIAEGRSSVTKELLKYIQAEDTGILVRLPCHLGDTVNFFAAGKVRVGVCRSISLHSGGMQVNLIDRYGENWSVARKHVFRDLDEAEVFINERGNRLAKGESDA